MDQEGLAFPYLEAAIGTGLGVRVMPVGLVAMWLAPWNKVPAVFMSALATRFINVVCVPAGITMGAPVSIAQFGRGEQGPAQGPAYEPLAALHGLFTVGIPNVAIVKDGKGLTPKELETLKIYTSVVCPTKKGAEELRTKGVRTMVVPPESDQLSSLFSGMNLA
jgi:hypothetical protein